MANKSFRLNLDWIALVNTLYNSQSYLSKIKKSADSENSYLASAFQRDSKYSALKYHSVHKQNASTIRWDFQDYNYHIETTPEYSFEEVIQYQVYSNRTSSGSPSRCLPTHRLNASRVWAGSDRTLWITKKALPSSILFNQVESIAQDIANRFYNLINAVEFREQVPLEKYDKVTLKMEFESLAELNS